jgi:uncharacterized protein (TIGR03083 family)
MPKLTDVWSDVHQERHALLELLEALTVEEWNTPSLCTEWRVRDVVGHMVSETSMTVPKVAWGLARSGFRINRYVAVSAQRQGETPITDLLEDFRSIVLSRAHLPGLSSFSMLADVVIHQMDIRRPLERVRSIPNRRMVPVAEDLWTNRFFPGPKLFKGMRVNATDTNWSAGTGLEVTGPIEALILTLAGRFVALEDLQGDGTTILQTRTAGMA